MTDILRAILVAVMVLAAPAGAALAQDGDAGAIRGVISQQIDAFRSDDVATAFDFASPMIRSMFGSPENFGRMVQGGYPMIWRPSSFEFGDLRRENGLLFQRLRVTDGSGAAFAFDYEMVLGPDGWKINGVYPVRDEGVGV